MEKFNRKKEFEKDDRWGHWGEGRMIDWITNHFKTSTKFVSYWYSSGDITKSKKEMKEFDLRFGVYNNTDRINWIDKIEFEIKTDGYDINTGNLIFENSCGRKKSGVFATKAKYFLYFLPLFNKDNIYLIQSEKLVKLLKSYNEYIVSGGDYGSQTHMYKIDKNLFDEEFKKVGGKIITYNDYTIPIEFEKKQFNEKKSTTYFSDSIKKYDDNLDF